VQSKDRVHQHRAHLKIQGHKGSPETLSPQTVEKLVVWLQGEVSVAACRRWSERAAPGCRQHSSATAGRQQAAGPGFALFRSPDRDGYSGAGKMFPAVVLRAPGRVRRARCQAAHQSFTGPGWSSELATQRDISLTGSWQKAERDRGCQESLPTATAAPAWPASAGLCLPAPHGAGACRAALRQQQTSQRHLKGNCSNRPPGCPFDGRGTCMKCVPSAIAGHVGQICPPSACRDNTQKKLLSHGLFPAGTPSSR